MEHFRSISGEKRKWQSEKEETGWAGAALRLKSQEECYECDRLSLTKLDWAPLGFSIRLCLWDFSAWESDLTAAVLRIRLKTVHHSV